MLKYHDTLVSFAEVPDELTLCINFVDCPYKCPGCHSPWLQGKDGFEFNMDVLNALMSRNTGISCVCFMGGDPTHLQPYFKYVHERGLKVAYYTGACIVCDCDRPYLDYIKVGSYDAKKGPLTSPTTNQRFFKRVGDRSVDFEDITEVFFKNINKE